MHIVFYTEGLPFDGETPEREALGGSESALVYMARALAARGQQVQVFCHCPRPGWYGGVRYQEVAQFGRFAAGGRCHVLVVSRFWRGLAAPVKSELNVLWNHDVLGPEAAEQVRGLLWKVDCLCGLSQFHREQLLGRLPEAAGVLWVTRNGVDLAAVEAARGGDRDRWRLLYTSRPERGLERLLGLWPMLRAAEPRLTLGIAHYLHPEADCQMAPLLGRLRDQAAALEGVELLGPLAKQALYHQMWQAGALAYPTHFPEISCIGALEAAGCGLPVVASRYCALKETVADGETGLLIAGDPDSPGYQERFAGALLGLLKDDGRWQRMSEAAQERAQAHAWDLIAGEWLERFEGALSAASSAARARHLAKQGELAAAELLLGGNGQAAAPIPTLAPGQGEAGGWPEQAWPWLERALAEAAPGSLLLAGPGAGACQRLLAERIPGLPLVIDRAARPEAALVVGLLEHAGDPGQALLEVEQSLPPGGKVLLALEYGPSHPDRLRGFDGDQAARALAGKDRLRLDFLELEGMQGGRRGLLLACYAADGQPTGWGEVAERGLCRPRQTLSVCMIVRDGASTLRRCLESVRPLADELLVYDTGSQDDSVELARRYADRVEQIEWPHDFSQARNRSIAQAQGDWILWIDADEYLVGGEHLGKYLRDNAYLGYVVRQHHFAVDAQFKPDYPVRLFRNGRGIRFYGAIHEHPETGLNQGVEPAVTLTDVHIMHDGYATEAVRRQRLRRNLPLLLRDRECYPQRQMGLVFLARDYLHLAKYEWEQHGALTPQARSYLEKVVALHRGHFLAPDARCHEHSWPIYQAALEMLGAGVEAACFLAVGESLPALGQVEPERQRFYCAQDLRDYLDHRLGQALARLQPGPEFPFEEEEHELRHTG